MRSQLKYMLFLFLLSSNFYAQEYSGKGEDINAILINNTYFSDACVNEDFDKLSSLYSLDGKMFPAGSDAVFGREAIKKRWTQPKGVKLLVHRVTPSEINVIDDYAYEYGSFQKAIQDKSGNESRTNGNYIIIWKKEVDDWKIYLDIWNTKLDDKKRKKRKRK